MSPFESLAIAMRALSANKVRTALTMLGVIIGVAAVILLVSIGSGVQEEVAGQIEGLGSNLLFVFPGNFEEGGGGGPSFGGGAQQFRLEDAELLQRRLESVDAVVPALQASVAAKAGAKTMRTDLTGTSYQGDEVFGSELAGGRFFRRSEYQASARVAVIGATVRERLFPNFDPVGREITLNGQRFRIVGHFEAQGGSFGGDQDNVVYVPVTTTQRLLGTDDISLIVIEASSADRVESVQSRAEEILEPRLGEDFTVFSQEQTLGIFQDLVGTLTFMLAGIAGISLLVGGIGIMNIMLVSVSERTREIGIRKAVGARTYDIMSQFVIEAVMLSVLGGVVGIAVGAGGAALLREWVPTTITVWAVALAFSFSAAVGVFFGVYPAYKASRLDPIVALRYE